MASSNHGTPATKVEGDVEEDLVARLETLLKDDDVKVLLEKFNSESAGDQLVGEQREGQSSEGQSSEVQVADVQFEFLDEDEDFQKKLADGGANPSANVDQWARNRINRFRQCMGWDVAVPFEELPSAECVKLLCKFFERVEKLNGELYPTYTLMGLYRAFNRMLRRQQERRIMATGIEEVPFNMRHSAFFKCVGVACVLSMERSRNAGANKPRKKAAVVTLLSEDIILGHLCTQISHPRGLQNRTFYFLEFRFTIRGGEELYKVLKANFMFSEDENGEFVRYDKRLSKNNKVGLDCYQDEHFRPAITNYDPDVIGTLKAMMLHLPSTALHLFMQVIDHPRTIYWFSSSRAGEKTLCNMMKNIHLQCGLDAENVMNKSGRTTAVTRMAMAGVHAAVGQRITGNKTLDAYQRYDRSLEAQVMAAQKSIADGSSYEGHLQVETQRFRDMVVNGVPYGVPKKINKSPYPMQMGGIYIDDDEPSGEESVVQTEATVQPVVKMEGIVHGGGVFKRKSVDESTNEEKSFQKPPKCGKVDYMGADDLKSALKDWDTWAEKFDWSAFESKILEERSIKINPVTAVFGRIDNMENCHVTINIQNLSTG